MTSMQFRRVMRRMTGILVCGAALGAAGCTLEKQTAPDGLIGPSEFGLSLTMSASPDQLPRDGQSRSTVTVTARDASGRVVSGQRLAVATSVGSLSASDITTGADGRATFVFTAPPSDVFASANQARIDVTPMGDNASNAVPRTLIINLSGTSNSTAPTPSFTVNPAAPELQQNTVFDA